MRYLYFNPKPTLKTNIKWQQHHQKIASLMKNCSKIEALNQIHGQMIRTDLIQDNFLVSRLISFFAVPSTHFNMDYARRVFDQIHHPNLFIWNSMIRGYTHICAPEDALSLFKQMLLRGVSADSYTYPIVIKACSQLRTPKLGELLHGLILKCGSESDIFTVSGFISFYASCGRIEVARELFDEMSERDVVTWTSMISGYAQLNHSEECFILFDEMKRAGVEPNNVTVVSLLSACGHLQAFDKGKWLHSYIVENKMECDPVVGNALMNMYFKCGSISCALQVFEKIPTRNTISWNVLIGGLVQNGLPTEALRFFQEMEGSLIRPNETTVVSALSACAQLGDLEQGKLLHVYIQKQRIKYDVFIGNALINMYAKCRDIEGAICVFRQMPDRDIFSWTSLITGCVHGGWFKEALSLFQEMQLSKVKPNEVTLVSLLSACAQLGAVNQGRRVHSYIVEHNVRQDVCLGNALVDMYAKCGYIEDAMQIFNGLPCRDIFSWNAMIGGLASHGHGREAIDLFSQMQTVGNIIPDGVTFTAVLSACTHSGMVHEGHCYFNSMSSLHGITPSIEHYGCVVDLLSRAGLLQEAFDFIEKMPIEPNPIIWGSLLSACRVHREVDLGERVAQKVLELAPDDKGVYVLLSHIYAEVGRWNDAKQVRALMGSRGLVKSPGCSSIEI